MDTPIDIFDCLDRAHDFAVDERTVADKCEAHLAFMLRTLFSALFTSIVKSGERLRPSGISASTSTKNQYLMRARWIQELRARERSRTTSKRIRRLYRRIRLQLRYPYEHSPSFERAQVRRSNIALGGKTILGALFRFRSQSLQQILSLGRCVLPHSEPRFPKVDWKANGQRLCKLTASSLYNLQRSLP